MFTESTLHTVGKETAARYAHTFTDCRRTDLTTLSVFPTDEQINDAARQAYDEAESLLFILGISPDLLNEPAASSWEVVDEFGGDDNDDGDDEDQEAICHRAGRIIHSATIFTRLSLPFSLFLMNHTLVYLPLLFKTFNNSHQSHKIEDNRPKCYCHDGNTRRSTEGPRPLWRARGRTERLSYIPHHPQRDLRSRRLIHQP